MKWICEWCEPSGIPAEYPEKCKILTCPIHKCRTWHYKEESNGQSKVTKTH